MKKSTLITGYLTAFIFLIGVIFKSLHYPYAGILITIGCVLFALAYGIPLFLEKNKVATNSYQKFFNLFILILILVIPTAFIHKIMHWPYAGILVNLSNILLLIGIPLIIFNAVKSKDSLKKLNFHSEAILFIMLTAFSIFILFSNTNKTILNAFAPIGNTVIAEMKYQESKSNELFTTLENAVNSNTATASYLEKAKAVKNASDSLNIYITELEKLMITATEQTDGNPDSLETIKAKAEFAEVHKVLFKDQQKAKELKEKLVAYKELLGQNTNSRGKDIITIFFNTDDPLPKAGDTMTWEEAKFEQQPLVAVLLTLNQTRSNIRLLEAETMTYLQAVAATSRPVTVVEDKDKEKKK
jgi:hypothetical protein